MYKVNQRMILVVKFGFLFGMPLLCSFLLSSLAHYRFVCLGLLFLAFYCNQIYPDRIAIDEHQVQIKIFLRNEWLCYAKSDVRFEQGKDCGYLIVQDKQRYRLCMDHLSRNLYEELRKLNGMDV